MFSFMLYNYIRIDFLILLDMARVGPGHCCYRIGPIRSLAGWHKRRS